MTTDSSQVKFTSSTPTPASMRSSHRREDAFPDPDRFLKKAKKLAIDNYNATRDRRRRALELEDVFFVWWSMQLGVWRAGISSSVARGHLWVVSCNEARTKVYIDIYRKHTSVILEEEEET